MNKCVVSTNLLQNYLLYRIDVVSKARYPALQCCATEPERFRNQKMKNPKNICNSFCTAATGVKVSRFHPTSTSKAPYEHHHLWTSKIFLIIVTSYFRIYQVTSTNFGELSVIFQLGNCILIGSFNAQSGGSLTPGLHGGFRILRQNSLMGRM